MPADIPTISESANSVSRDIGRLNTAPRQAH